MPESKIDQRFAGQADKFRQAAEDAQCDPDEARWEERLRKVAGHKPAPEPEKPE